MMPSIGSPEIYGRQMAQLAEEKMSQFVNLMDRFDTLDWSKNKNIVTVGIWDVSRTKEIINIIRRYEKTDKKPGDIPGLEYLLRTAIGPSIRLAEKLGGITGLGSMVFEPEMLIDEYQYYNPDIMIMGFKEGNFGRMSGNPRKGKTSNSCLMIERWNGNNNIALSNIYKKEETNKYIYVKDARDLFTMISDMPRNTQWIFVYDEGGLSYSKLHSSTIHSRYMNEVARIIGKLYGNMLYIDQIPEACPETIQKFSTNTFHALEPGKMFIELKGPYKFKRTLRNIPQTTLPYDTRDIAYFDSKDLNVEGMFSYISGTENPYDAMAEYLESKESIPKPLRKVSSKPEKEVATATTSSE